MHIKVEINRVGNRSCHLDTIMYLLILLLLVGTCLGLESKRIPGNARNGQRPHLSRAVVRTVNTDADRAQLRSCFEHFLDPDHTGVVTRTQLNTILVAMSAPGQCISSKPAQWYIRYTIDFLMASCDADNSGSLTVADWNSPKACLRHPDKISYVKAICRDCGWSEDARRNMSFKAVPAPNGKILPR